ncbi:unnamed protein product [Kuraishia capsulata CBS 1993]|uniref:Aldehyde dehydrogenase domain-containing protein n=1 Tax=Kuraishia capsulata CBS 1993 TaxID=1382522 RepID=W6MMS2_9ASCO|nr:uncharacterized protein KUCA_T00003856001 [Kuraishia capsulata CBS 1993]CDK27876.1 unnamed protein product [Kuraishia capsulata CBS 1993]
MSSDLFQEITLPNGVTYKQPVGLFINGEWVKSDETIESIDPATERVITKVYLAGTKEVDSAVSAARTAFKTWKKVEGTTKGSMLMKLADLVEKNRDLLAAVESADSGKPFESNAKFDIDGTISYFRYCAGWADKVHGKSIPVQDGKLAFSKRIPIGVCGQIVPWNYPISMSGWKIAPALAAGNCIIIKSAETTPLSLLVLADLVNEAGFPKGVFNVLSGLGPVAGAHLVAHPGVDKIAFTGSTVAGAKIQQMAASNLKAVTLECGGKSPLLVFEDADLDLAAGWAAFGIMYNTGQNCTSNSRIYVHDSVYEKFIELFVARVKKDYPIGEPFDENAKVGPVVSKAHFDRVTNYIEIGKKEGAKMILGSEPIPFEKGYYIQPTVFVDCKQDMRIIQEEIFGPVVAISRFSTEDEVVEKANDSIYGLAAMVFSQDIMKAHRVADELEAGMVYINSSNDEDIRVPFGGVKMSGVGRELGESGIHTYTQEKAIHCNLGAKL